MTIDSKLVYTKYKSIKFKNIKYNNTKYCYITMTIESISLCINLFQETPPNPAEVAKSIKGKKGKLTFDDDHINPQDNGG